MTNIIIQSTQDVHFLEEGRQNKGELKIWE